MRKFWKELIRNPRIIKIQKIFDFATTSVEKEELDELNRIRGIGSSSNKYSFLFLGLLVFIAFWFSWIWGLMILSIFGFMFLAVFIRGYSRYLEHNRQQLDVENKRHNKLTKVKNK